MTLDCYDFYLWSTGQLKIPRSVEREIFKEVGRDLRGVWK